MTLFDKHILLRSKINGNYRAARTVAQIGYALKLSAVNESKYDGQIAEVVEYLVDDINANGSITNPAAIEAEKRLAFMSELAKKTKIICVSHAHIDMNWMWGYQETAATTVDTFRTVLDLMDEYKDFTYSQSQASVYKIIEETDPDMIDEIKRRVKEGRWEITASTWVETDKNMPNGESLARHILYTKRYLSKLLDVKGDSMQLDFEPDTFGHNWSVPEIMNKGGVKYYYHCRAYEGENLYNWTSRNGATVLVYREPKWYNADIDYDMFYDVPQFCQKYDVDVMLKVYGVGNHGGGPTRRDVERIADMMTWTVMPTIEFGTYHNFFKLLEKHASKFKTVNQELNFVFTGCYTSQSRIKMANRISEDRLFEAETVGAASSLLNGKSFAKSFSKAWENVLFNHFHDILPGSGVIDTREYAMGIFQKTMAAAQTNMTNAMRTIASNIDTSGINIEIDKNSNAEGGGVGYGVEHRMGFKFPQTERGSGKVRVFHFFNPTMFEKNGPVEFAVWDWHYDQGQISIKGSDGVAVEWKHTQHSSHYWGHMFFKVVANLKIPALGYATYVLTEEPRQAIPGMGGDGERNDHYSDADVVMENDKIKVTFDRRTMQIISMVDKKSGKDLVCKDRPAGAFRFIMEDDTHGMTAWRVGHYMKVENLNETYDVKAHDFNLYGIRKWIRYEIKFKNSKLNVTMYLDKNSPTLKYNITVDWHEVGRQGQGTPQLNFFNPICVDTKTYRYDIPFATIDRPEKHFDMPGNSYAVAVPQESEKTVMVVTDTKYGFRTVDSSIAVDLIRSSYEPDPYPEYGVHSINVGIAIPENMCNHTLKQIRDDFVHVIPFISGKKHGGTLPLNGTMFKLSGDVLLSSVKTAEDSADGKTIIVRLYDANGKGSTAKLDFGFGIDSACVMDINENPIKNLPLSGNSVSVEVPAYEVVTLALTVG